MKPAYIFDAVRTPIGIGNAKGALYGVKSVNLLATVFKGLEQRCNLDTTIVSDAIIGCSTPIGGQGNNIAKAALLKASWSSQVSGLQINRYAASALEAINLAALKVGSGYEALVVAGGVESNSQVQLHSDGGALINDPATINKANYLPDGIAADVLATLSGFSREQLDAFAFQSLQRATQADKADFFAPSIIPVEDKIQLPILSKDEYLSAIPTQESITNASPAFPALGQLGYNSMALQKYPQLEQILHLHTPSNVAQLADAAALILIGSEEVGTKMGWTPRAVLRAYGLGSHDPTLMHAGNVPAAMQALENAQLSPSAIDLWSCHEPYAAVALHFQQHFEIPDEKFNTSGGAIAFGQAQGAVGAIQLCMLLDDLERNNLQRGLLVASGAAGLGVATIIERV